MGAAESAGYTLLALLLTALGLFAALGLALDLGATRSTARERSQGSGG